MTKPTTRPLAALSAAILTVVLFAQTYAVPSAMAQAAPAAVVVSELA